MHLLPTAKIYLLRAVLALCVASLLSYIPIAFIGPFQEWLALGLFIFILVHHVLMSLNIDFLHPGLIDLPLLLLEIVGFAFYIRSRFYTPIRPTETIFVLEQSTRRAIDLIFPYTHMIFLLLEAVLRIGPLTIYVARRGQVSSHYLSLLDVASQESLKAYQVIFGRSMSRALFKGSNKRLSTQYYVSALQMKFVLSARKILLRLVLASSLASLVLVVEVGPAQEAGAGLQYPDYLWMGLLPFVILHHLISCASQEFDYCLADLPLLLFEILRIAPYISSVGSFSPWSASSLISYTILSWIILVCLGLEVLIWVGSLILYVTQSLLSLVSLDFQGRTYSKPQDILFGHSLWKVHLAGETQGMRVIRGFVAAIVILAIISFSVVDIFLNPIQGTGLIPTKEFRLNKNITELNMNPEVPAWNMVFLTPNLVTEGADWDSVFQAAVNVTPLAWSGAWLDKWPSGQCVHTPGVFYDFGPFHTLPAYMMNTVQCPLMTVGNLPVAIDLLITVNFTKLYIPAGNLTTSMTQYSLQTMIGLTNDSSTVVERTLPTTLVPGTNLVGAITWEFHQVLKSRSLSTFGLFTSYKTILVARTLNIFPDPLVSGSALIPQASDIATFRVFMPNDLSLARIVQDYTEKSVLQGFSDVGGLWTFLSGIFAAIFGSTIMRILFGVQPISFLGFFHLFRQKEVQKACLQEYPGISKEMKQPRSEQGLLALLCDQLIDTDFLEGEEISAEDLVEAPMELQEMDQVAESDS